MGVEDNAGNELSRHWLHMGAPQDVIGIRPAGNQPDDQIVRVSGHALVGKATAAVCAIRWLLRARDAGHCGILLFPISSVSETLALAHSKTAAEPYLSGYKKP